MHMTYECDAISESENRKEKKIITTNKIHNWKIMWVDILILSSEFEMKTLSIF